MTFLGILTSLMHLQIQSLRIYEFPDAAWKKLHFGPTYTFVDDKTKRSPNCKLPRWHGYFEGQLCGLLRGFFLGGGLVSPPFFYHTVLGAWLTWPPGPLPQRPDSGNPAYPPNITIQYDIVSGPGGWSGPNCVACKPAQLNHVMRRHEKSYGAQYHQHPGGMSSLTPLTDAAQ